MAIVSVTEDLKSGEVVINWERSTYQRIFTVETDSFADNGIVVSSAPGIPPLYSPYVKGNDFDFRSELHTIRPRRNDDNPFIWTVVCDYQQTLEEENQEEGNENTIELRLPEINVSEITYEEAVWKDRDDKPIENSAGDAFPVMPTVTKRIRVFEVMQYYRRWEDLQQLRTYENTVNDGVVWGLPAESLLCKGAPGGVRKKDKWGTYWESRLILQHKEPNWNERIADQGFFQLLSTGVTTQRYRILDEDFNALTEPSNLNGSGAPVAKGQPAAVLEFPLYEKKDFGPLNLPRLDVRWYIPNLQS